MNFFQPIVKHVWLLLCLGFTAVYAQNNTSIQLKSGSYDLPKNLAILEKSNSIDASELVDGNYFRIIQFSEIPSVEVQANLLESGVKLLGYIPQNSYYASIKSGTNLNILNDKNVLSVNKVAPDFKLSKKLKSKKFENWAVEGDYIKLNGVYYETIDEALILNKLEALKIKVISNNSAHIVQFVIKINELENIYKWPEFFYFEQIEKPGEPENLVGVTNHRSNTLATSYLNGLHYDGTGVTIMLQDNSILDEHIDYTGRFTNSGTAQQAGDHGEHCGGTIAGAGNLDPVTRGMAYGANVLVYDWPNNNYNAVPNLVNNNDLTITSKSYSNGVNAGYTGLANQLDGQIRQMQELIHVFSAGNSNGQGNTPAGSQWYNITGGHKSAKNVMAVGNLTSLDGINNSSSRGPAEDGRIKPDICAVGTAVYSTIDANMYGYKTGTSMSCPGVAGTLAQLYHAYKDLNGGVNPPSGLIKGAVLNTGEDLGNPGPDFIYGWGRINARRAFEVLSNNQYFTDNINQGGFNAHSITVPTGISELRVMVYWTDFEASPSALTALVNDIDMTITGPTGTTYNPWILDATPNSTLLNSNAVTGTDHLNNMEQITVNLPPSGVYDIDISGFSIPMGTQNYYVVYEMVTDDVVLTYPIGGESFDSDENEIIRWDAYGNSGTFKLEYSPDNGLSWNVIINSIAADVRAYSWNVPAIVSGKTLVRISRGSSLSQSHEPFSIIRVPTGLTVIGACPDSMTVSWNAVTDATAYEVSVLGTKYMDSVGTTTGNFLTIYAPSTIGKWWSVKALGPDDCVGRRAIAKYQGPGMFTCNLAQDAGISNSVPSGGSNFANCVSSNMISIGVRINNMGTNSIDNIPVYYQLNNGTVVAETYTGSISSNNFYDYTFTTPATPAFGFNQLSIWSGLISDQNNQNDSLAVTFNYFNSIPQSLPWSEDFESFPLCATTSNCEVQACATDNGWVNEINGTADDIDWRTNEGTTPSSTTGPMQDFNPGTETGNYMYLEISSNPLCEIKEGHLTSPCIEIDVVSVLKFAYSMNGSDMGELHVDIFVNGAWELDVMPMLSGDQGDDWLEGSILLGNYVGEIINVRFRGITGDGYRSDMAIDDIRIISTVGISESNPNFAFDIHPNPSTGIFNYTFYGNEQLTIEVVDLNGKVVLRQNLKAHESKGSIDLTGYANGLYAVTITGQSGRMIHKIVKQ